MIEETIMENSLTNGLFASMSDIMLDRISSISHIIKQVSQRIVLEGFQELIQDIFMETDGSIDCTFGIDFLWQSIDVNDLQSRLNEPNVHEYLDRLSKILHPDRQVEEDLFFVNQDHIHFQRSYYQPLAIEGDI